MRSHEIADCFPMLSKEELADLVEDIREHGLRDPILLFENRILDGRNRFRACELSGVKPRYEVFDGNWYQAVALVASRNLRRRHLTTSQRAYVADKLANCRPGDNQHTKVRDEVADIAATSPAQLQRKLRERQELIAKENAEREAAIAYRREHPEEVQAALARLQEAAPDPLAAFEAEVKADEDAVREEVRQICLTTSPSKTDDEDDAQVARTQAVVAKEGNISPRLVRQMGKVRRKAEPELYEAVGAGQITVNAASELAALPPEEQKAVAAGEQPVREALKKAKAAKAPRDPMLAVANAVTVLENALHPLMDKSLSEYRAAVIEAIGRLRAAADWLEGRLG